MSTLDSDDLAAIYDLTYKITRDFFEEMKTELDEAKNDILERKYDADVAAIYDLTYKIVRDFTEELKTEIDETKHEILERKYDADVLQDTFESFLYDLKLKMEKWNDRRGSQGDRRV